MSLISNIYNRRTSKPYSTKKTKHPVPPASSTKDRKLSKRQYLKKFALKDKRCHRCGSLEQVQEFSTSDKTVQRYCAKCVALFKRCPHKAPHGWLAVPLEKLEKTFSLGSQLQPIPIPSLPPIDEPPQLIVSHWIDERPLPAPVPRKKKQLSDEEKVFWTKYRRRTRKPPSKLKSKKKKGSKPSDPPHGPVRVLWKDGKPLLPPSSNRPDISCPKGSPVGVGEVIGPQRHAANAGTPSAPMLLRTGKSTTY